MALATLIPLVVFERYEDIMDALHDDDLYGGEIEAEYRNEVALFGDAWPGAALQIAAGKERIAALKAERDALIEMWPGIDAPPVAPFRLFNHDFVPGADEPF